jgi:hypothetical protein
LALGAGAVPMGTAGPPGWGGAALGDKLWMMPQWHPEMLSFTVPGPVPGLTGASTVGLGVGVVLGAPRPTDGLVTGWLGVVCEPPVPPDPAMPVAPLVPRLPAPADDDALAVGVGVVVDEVVPLELEPQAAATATNAATIGSAYLDLMELAFMMWQRVGETEVSVSRLGQCAEETTTIAVSPRTREPRTTPSCWPTNS